MKWVMRLFATTLGLSLVGVMYCEGFGSQHLARIFAMSAICHLFVIFTVVVWMLTE